MFDRAAACDPPSSLLPTLSLLEADLGESCGRSGPYFLSDIDGVLLELTEDGLYIHNGISERGVDY